MFEYNGYIYGGQPKEILSVTNAKPLENRMMIVEFSNGEKRLFDTTILTGPAFEPLKDETIFRNILIDHGILTWNNGEIDCSTDFLYKNSYEYAAVS